MLYQDYAIETPLEKLSEGDSFYEVTINLNLESSVAALNFVLKVLLLNLLQQTGFIRFPLDVAYLGLLFSRTKILGHGISTKGEILRFLLWTMFLMMGI